MSQLFLAFHLLGATFISGLIIFSLYSVFGKPNDALLAPISRHMAYGMVYQVATGASLSLAKSAAVGTFCTRIGLYLAIVLGAEAVLFFKLRSTNFAFPMHTLKAAVMACFGITVLTVGILL